MMHHQEARLAQPGFLLLSKLSFLSLAARQEGGRAVSRSMRRRGAPLASRRCRPMLHPSHQGHSSFNGRARFINDFKRQFAAAARSQVSGMAANGSAKV
ncbi:hypothetical protein AC630_37175 [Bradyrhizobium sp. AS23.2]|nr:hypothetical protein AC630_37175 [Bradyrhizobium sp. AS23.2]